MQNAQPAGERCISQSCRPIGQDVQDLIVGISVVYDDRLAQLGCPGQLCLKGPPLRVTGRQVPVIVQADLAHRHDLGVLRQLAQLPQRGAIQFLCAVGVHPHGGIDLLIFLCQYHGPAAGNQVGSHVHDRCHAGGLGPPYYGWPVGVELGEIEVGVRVDQCRRGRQFAYPSFSSAAIQARITR